MIRIVEPGPRPNLTLKDYAADMAYASAVASLRAEAERIRPTLEGRTIWMVSSTSAGGGVAEMIPRLQALMRELGLDVRWAVIQTEEPRFFALTKRIHNLIHDDTLTGRELGAEDARLFEAVNRENADSLRPHLRAGDILEVHDPQPLALGSILATELGLAAVWRCHIGLDERTDATRRAWDFLRGFTVGYRRAIFSVSQYVPSYLTGRSAIIYPAIDPISHKNRDLAVNKMVGILCNAGLQAADQPVPTPAYEAQATRALPDGGWAAPGDIGLLFRPIVLQVSRWDRLKGWLPLLEGFSYLKRELTAQIGQTLGERNRRRLELARLVLAGPDPESIADDPEGVLVFRQVIDAYHRLEPALRQDVVVLGLPMRSRKENALTVNALQRCASIVVQNSLREGFGLTVTEAMWKRIAVVGSSACGIREQIRDGVDGLLVSDPCDPQEIAARLLQLLCHPRQRYELGRSGQLRVHDEFLVFRQISSYLRLFERL